MEIADKDFVGLNLGLDAKKPEYTRIDHYIW